MRAGGARGATGARRRGAATWRAATWTNLAPVVASIELMDDVSRDLEAYAALAAELADPRVDRAAVLAARGLDEERWNTIDDAWQVRLSEADEGDVGDDETGGIPPLIAAHAEAFARAQRARVRGVLPFERFLEAAREMKRGTDLSTALKRLDLSLDAYLHAQAHWTAEMLADEGLAARFQRAMR